MAPPITISSVRSRAIASGRSQRQRAGAGQAAPEPVCLRARAGSLGLSARSLFSAPSGPARGAAHGLFDGGSRRPRPLCVAGAMPPVQAGTVDSTAGAGAAGGRGPYGGQQSSGALQPQAPAARYGGQLFRWRPTSRDQASPVAGGVATEDPELVDCGGAEFADSAAPSSDRTGQAGGGRPGGGPPT